MAPLRATLRQHHLVCAAIALLACEEVPPPNAPIQETPRHLYAVQDGPDRNMAELLALIPGFGGAFIARDSSVPTPQSGVVVAAYITAAGDSAAATTALRNWFEGRGYEVSDVRILKGNYSYDELQTWARQIRDVLLSNNRLGGVSLDADERYNKVTIGVQDATVDAIVRSAVAGLSIPPDAWRIQSEGVQRRLQSTDSTVQSRFRPIPGGVEIGLIDAFGQSSTCTLGFNVVRDAALRFLTASHCTAVEFGSDTGSPGTQYFRQPLSSGELLGPEYVDPPAWIGNPCASGRYCRYSDAAMFTYPGGPLTGQHGALVRPVGQHKLNIYGGARDTVQSSSWYPIVGDDVDKIGRTTGRTRGFVTQVCVYETSSFPGPTSPDFPCVGRTDADADHGDSGGPVLHFISSFPTRPYLVGLVGGDYSPSTGIIWFSLISEISRDLGGLGTLRP